MASLDDLMSRIPVDQVAQRLGVDNATAETAVRAALPTLVGGLDAGRRFVEATQLCQLATSLGGPETLVTHPASTTHVNLLPDELEAAGIGPGTIRMSVGLEATEDVLADVHAALDALDG